jgi:hypothetical protein
MIYLKDQSGVDTCLHVDQAHLFRRERDHDDKVPSQPKNGEISRKQTLTFCSTGIGKLVHFSGQVLVTYCEIHPTLGVGDAMYL